MCSTPRPWFAVPCFVAALFGAPTPPLGAQAPAPARPPVGTAWGEFAPRRFDFGVAEGVGAVAPGWTAVTPADVFSAERGYGFEPAARVEAVVRAGDDALRHDFITGAAPFLFSVAVPEGNYRVTVTLGDAAGESSTTIKAESRRLMIARADTATGAFTTRSFIVNVRNATVPPPPLNAPGGDAVRLNDRERGVYHWDDKLTLEFNGAQPKVCGVEIERVSVPVVFLAGDSTVTDQPREPGASWGQMLTRWFKPDIAIANHAESGETMKSFITGLRLDKILSELKAGDYLFIQFGHNDSKVAWPQTYVEASTTYKTYLRVFIAEARRRGATPVLLSSMERKGGVNGNTHGGYPAAVREVAAEEHVAFIDLWTISKTLYAALGPDLGEAFNDPTHHNNYGAYELARCVVEGIRTQIPDLAAHLSDDVTPFDPAKPDPLERVVIPRSPGFTREKPRGD